MTAIAWCTSFSSLEIRRVSRRNWRRLRCRPTAAALPNTFSGRDRRVGGWIPDICAARAARVPMAGGAANVAAANVLALVLLAGGPAAGAGAGAGAGWRRLVVLANRRRKVAGRRWLLIVSAVLLLSTLGSDCPFLLLPVGAVIERVVRRSSSLCAFCTLGSGWAMLVVAGVVTGLGFVGAADCTMVGL